MKNLYIYFCFMLAGLSTIHTTKAQEAPEAFMGEIRIYAGDIAPEGWAFCHGQILPIDKYTAFYSVIGTTYGGDGSKTFALPDLRGRMAMGAGQSPNSYNVATLGELNGNSASTLGIEKGDAIEHPITVQPFVAVRYIICINGIYPKRN